MQRLSQQDLLMAGERGLLIRSRPDYKLIVIQLWNQLESTSDYIHFKNAEHSWLILNLSLSVVRLWKEKLFTDDCLPWFTFRSLNASVYHWDISAVLAQVYSPSSFPLPSLKTSSIEATRRWQIPLETVCEWGERRERDKKKSTERGRDWRILPGGARREDFERENETRMVVAKKKDIKGEKESLRGPWCGREEQAEVEGKKQERETGGVLWRLGFHFI